MKDYKQTVQIRSNPGQLFRALTEGIPAWWSTSEGPSQNVGNEFKVSFGPESYWVFQIIKSIPDERVIWKCIESHQDHNLKGLDEEWLNTELDWTISEQGDGVMLDFHHKGLTRSGVCYDVCSKAWDFYVLESLKQYLESGIGRPGES